MSEQKFNPCGCRMYSDDGLSVYCGYDDGLSEPVICPHCQHIAKLGKAMEKAYRTNVELDRMAQRANDELHKRRILDANADYWAWVGDGYDQPGSMGEEMVVHITGGDIRRLIKGATSEALSLMTNDRDRWITAFECFAEHRDCATEPFETREWDELRGMLAAARQGDGEGGGDGG